MHVYFYESFIVYKFIIARIILYVIIIYLLLHNNTNNKDHQL